MWQVEWRVSCFEFCINKCSSRDAIIKSQSASLLTLRVIDKFMACVRSTLFNSSRDLAPWNSVFDVGIYILHIHTLLVVYVLYILRTNKMNFIIGNEPFFLQIYMIHFLYMFKVKYCRLNCGHQLQMKTKIKLIPIRFKNYGFIILIQLNTLKV